VGINAHRALHGASGAENYLGNLTVADAEKEELRQVRDEIRAALKEGFANWPSFIGKQRLFESAALRLYDAADPVLRPKFAVPTVVPGLLKFTTLKALNPSARYCSRTRSVNRKFLKIPISKFLNPGPRSALRPRLPNVYCGATAKAAGLK